jgi:tetratricopeptide (TPR) repeat protein
MRDPRSLLAYQVLLELALRQGDEDLVNLLALKAQKARPQAALPAYYLGKLAERRHDLEKATAQFQAAIALRPDFEPAFAELAGLALAHQDYAGAETALRKVLQLDPHACAAHLDLGVAERGLQKADAAAAEYQEAIRCDGKLVQAYYDLGLVQQQITGDCGAAIDSYRKFISGNATPLPGDHPVFAALQECQQRQAQDEQKRQAEAAVQAAKQPAAAGSQAAPAAAGQPAAPAAAPAPAVTPPPPPGSPPPSPADPREPQN